MLLPTVGVDVIVTTPVEQRELLPAVGADGLAFTVANTAVLVALTHLVVVFESTA